MSPPATDLPAEVFRDVMRHFAAGVTLVTTERDGLRHGMTATAFASVSSFPPLISVMIDQAHGISPFLAAEDAGFAVSILAEEQATLADRFAFFEAEKRFAAGDWTRSASGAPVLADAIAWLDCRVHARIPAGTHVVYLGAVSEGKVVRPDSAPLVYWNRGYRSLNVATHTSPADGVA